MIAGLARTQLGGERGGLGAALHAELVEQVGHVVLDGLLGEEELLADLPVGQALAGVGVALLLGIGMRIAAVSGTLLLVLMWAAEWPLARFTDAGEPTMSTHPFLDDHIIYAIVLILLAVTAAGNTWGFGKFWANLDLVKKYPWLR